MEFEPMYAVAIVGVEHIKVTDTGLACKKQTFGQWKVTGKEGKERLIALLDEIGKREGSE